MVRVCQPRSDELRSFLIVICRFFVCRFSQGLLPVLDLFNHAEATPDQYVKLSASGDSYELRSTRPHKAGTEVFNYYLPRNALTLYRLYNILDVEAPLDCDSMRALRRGEPIKRVACIAYWKEGVDAMLMVDEIKEAAERGDWTMVKGAAQWLDRNSDFML